MNEIELSIVLPCLNEEKTLHVCLTKASDSISKLNLEGEIIVADNGSTDSSLKIAEQFGAKIVNVAVKGYGAALIEGIKSAKGKYIIMGDSDDSYALDQLEEFISKLREGNDLVMGNRFKGGIEKGAMPWLHKYVGNPLLSFIGRLFFKVPIHDFHCGLRGFKRDAILKLNLISTGMEFASEMIVKAALSNLKITEVPTKLKPDGRDRAPHLRTWRDGWRHLIFLLASSPRWLFLYPGIFLFTLGTLGMILTSSGEVHIFNLNLNLNSFLVFTSLVLAGAQTILMGLIARVFASEHGFLPVSKEFSFFEKYFTLERGITLGLFLIFSSGIWFVKLISDWTGTKFNNFDLYTSVRISATLLLALVLGFQILFASFFASLMKA